MSSHGCCPACRIHFAPADAPQACPRCGGALVVLRAQEVLGHARFTPVLAAGPEIDIAALSAAIAAETTLPPRASA